MLLKSLLHLRHRLAGFAFQRRWLVISEDRDSDISYKAVSSTWSFTLFDFACSHRSTCFAALLLFDQRSLW